MKLIVLKSTWYLAGLAAFSATVAWAQSPAAPTGDGPTWAYMAALFLLLLIAMGKWIFHTVNKDISRVETANVALRLEVQALRTKVTEDHLDRDATRDLINMVVRIAVSDQMKTELQTIQGQLNNIVLALATMTPQHHKPGEG